MSLLSNPNAQQAITEIIDPRKISNELLQAARAEAIRTRRRMVDV